MVDRSDEVLGVTIAVGPMTYELDLVVHPFEGAIGDPDASPGQDAGSMATPVSIHTTPEKGLSIAEGVFGVKSLQLISLRYLNKPVKDAPPTGTA